MPGAASLESPWTLEAESDLLKLMIELSSYWRLSGAQHSPCGPRLCELHQILPGCVSQVSTVAVALYCVHLLAPSSLSVIATLIWPAASVTVAMLPDPSHLYSGDRATGTAGDEFPGQ